MSAEDLLSRLEKSRKTGSGTWIACCPAHKDKNPSMTVRELDDGRVLVHCFAGCSTEDVLGAVGLEFDSLFPPKPQTHLPRLRKPFPAADVLEALMSDALLMQQVAKRIEVESPEFAQVMRGVVSRISMARDLVNG